MTPDEAEAAVIAYALTHTTTPGLVAALLETVAQGPCRVTQGKSCDCEYGKNNSMCRTVKCSDGMTCRMADVDNALDEIWKERARTASNVMVTHGQAP